MKAEDIIAMLELHPLPLEGGHYAETYRSSLTIARARPDGQLADRAMLTAIYYLLTSGSWSALHRLPSDEIFHHYIGDPVEMLLLYPDGTSRVDLLGKDLSMGERPQVIVPRGVWQGSRLKEHGQLALLGTTMSPGFEFEDYEHGRIEALLEEYPDQRDRIKRLAKK